jgi:NAD(P)-dependent dehydrogenase (short-subunit alcohol dehydrogenase family)
MPTGRLLDQDPAQVARVMQVNYGGALHLARAALPAMLERGSLFAFPSRSARTAWRLRRYAPRFLSSQIHRIEGW